MVENDNINKLDEILKFSIWLAMDISSSKEDGLKIVKDSFSDLDITGSFSFGSNPLPQSLRNTNITNPEVGIKVLLEYLRDYVEFINNVIKNIEKHFSGPREEWRIYHSETQLMELHDIASVLEREIKGQFVRCVDDFLKNPAV